MNNHRDTQFQQRFQHLFIYDKVFAAESESESLSVAVKKTQRKKKTHSLAEDRRQSRAEQRPLEPDDKNQIKNHIGTNRYRHKIKGMTAVAHAPQNRTDDVVPLKLFPCLSA